VLSRRLGRSLGIDPIMPKTCNFSCVYCQLGRTRPLVNERQEHVPCADVLRDLKSVLREREPGTLDWVTFVGSGETTLHARLGLLIRQVKELTSLPVAVITNGSLLYDSAVRDDLQAADAVLPSLDAGTPALFRRMARPHPQCTFERLVEGLIAFRQEYHGNLWLEVMLVSGLNDSEQALRAIEATARRIAPDEIHIILPDRPPAESYVRPPDEAALTRAVAILGTAARIVAPAHGAIELDTPASAADVVMDIITRHPMRQAELEAYLPGRGATAVAEALSELESRGRACRVERYGECFWRAVESSPP